VAVPPTAAAIEREAKQARRTVAVGGTFHPPAWPYNSPPTAAATEGAAKQPGRTVAVEGTFRPPAWPYNTPPPIKASKPENPEAEELVSAATLLYALFFGSYF
jgi:hypothetical protein